ncbi:hypothetical protein DMN91_005133 [Ooceraea biroi]|uniref:Uncharacterized protein n=1 Tax=Ooceraea biroi TaxID=2015173 RepID=A0A026WZC6_OOCBI|nr:uncharacterized protein LOC105287657 [Ooceraea biroi]XP_011351632.1 uncharacterized protein LOC105287657 [Ooceraea biroi]XP_011351633.1 uncharacterized protein LOC105287657 [Ooceraea biroi]EZA61158.1 hypothetical protein X777_08370 [Ooceraea biroi]RLU22855.1 hypothetical protein DMN91_005133 [Ooceraea biroi]
MKKSQKLDQKEKRRERTLNVCLPHIIKDTKDIESLFVGNFHVKLPRQSSKSCHVVFPSVEEKIKNHKLAKDKTINGKRIIIRALPALVPNSKTKKKKKKLFMPEVKSDIKVTQTLFISNILNGTKSHEVREIIPGCVHVTLLKPYNKNFRSAIAKMETIQVAANYLKRQSRWPVLKGHTLRLKPDTRQKHKRKASSKTLKIYDATATEECKSDGSSDHIDDNDESD